MILGERIKRAIEQKGLNPDEVAVHAGMVVSNLYKIFKRDSVDSKYLEKIAEKLEVPIGSFFVDAPVAYSQTASGTGNIAGSGNKQKVQVGSMGAEECVQKLEALQEKYDLQQQLLAEKERTIEILIKQK